MIATQQPSDIADFQSWLAKGLGRAAVFLKRHDSGPYLDALLHACTHYVHYDLQCEDSRVPYLWTLIGLSKNPTFFRDALLKILLERRENPDDVAWSQVFGLARHFAMQGDPELRQAMYKAFEQLSFEKSGLAPAEELVYLDGLEGFFFVAKLFDIASNETEIWEFDVVVSALEGEIGKDRAHDEIQRRTTVDPHLAQLMRAIEEHRRLWDRPREKPTSRPDYTSLLERPWDKEWGSELRVWVETASREELKVLAGDFAKAKDDNKLISILRIFGRHEYTGDITALFAFIDDKRRHIKGLAIRALRNVHHPSVRAKGLEFLQSLDRPDDGVNLLVGNFELGDFQLIEGAIQKASNPEVLHGLGFAVNELFEKRALAETAKSLLFLYEKDPCYMCRADIVADLVKLKCVPEWMREECLYDAESKTRGLADGSAAADV